MFFYHSTTLKDNPEDTFKVCSNDRNNVKNIFKGIDQLDESSICNSNLLAKEHHKLQYSDQQLYITTTNC